MLVPWDTANAVLRTKEPLQLACSQSIVWTSTANVLTTEKVIWSIGNNDLAYMYFVCILCICLYMHLCVCWCMHVCLCLHVVVHACMRVCVFVRVCRCEQLCFLFNAVLFFRDSLWKLH